MPQLYLVTVPGLHVAWDWAAVHDRLLDGFPEITDVLATTMTATLLIVCEGDAHVDAWLKGIGDGILSRRIRGERVTAARARTRPRGRERTWGLRRTRHGAPVTASWMSAAVDRHNPTEGRA